MLVYAKVCKKDTSPTSSIHSGTKHQAESPLPTSSPEVVPPPRAVEVVNSLNAEHVKACEEFRKRYASLRDTLIC